MAIYPNASNATLIIFIDLLFFLFLSLYARTVPQAMPLIYFDFGAAPNVTDINTFKMSMR